MEHKKLNKIIAFLVFLVSLVVYIRTLSPTVVFWDVGEFCAAAFSLQVPHPPGAPLFLLLARISSMIPSFHDIAVRMHLLSALGSALTCGLLYLIIVELLTMWKGLPSSFNDRMTIYGSAVIGALSLAFIKTFWFNAVEAEVYGLSMTFVGLIILLALRWYERAEQDSGDRYILLIAYIVGLSVGVHLLAVLTIFPVMMLWYFRYNKFSWTSFGKFTFSAIVIFLIVYPGVVTILPSLLDGEIQFGETQLKNSLISYIPVVLVLGAFTGIYYSIIKKKRILNVALLSFLLIVLGYSTYLMVYIRANKHTPMNENDPSSLGRLVSYLNREQYGSAPIINRRWDFDPEKQEFHKNYSSDFDYMLRYQIEHMYLRYLAWNYIGSEGDFKDAGVNWKGYYLVPFLLGVLGAYYQWRKQPKIAWTMTAMFIIMGVVLALYQNQQEPQPRERDYFYVGSFFVFSLWISYGIIALIDFIKLVVTKPALAQVAQYSVLTLACVFVPLSMLKSNYHEANRTGNYVAWDYSYNMLQSCEQDAILITNGDNDTFPLWYLQDVEGIRRDIRIVNLSLLNMPWYIKQLKNETPYGSKPVPITTSDADIENISPIPFKTSWIEFPVSKKILQAYEAEGYPNTNVPDTSMTNSGVLRFQMPSTLHYANVDAIRAQDIIMHDILMTNNWQRPIYFGMTVPDDGKIGLRDYMQLTGLTFKLVPCKAQSYWTNLDEQGIRRHLFTDIHQPSRDRQYGFLWRGFQDSTTYYDQDTRQLITSNYRNVFIAYALYCANIKNKPQEMSEILDRMERVIPGRSIPLEYQIKYNLASFYNEAGNTNRYRELLLEVIQDAKQVIQKPVTERLSEYNPYIILIYSYEALGKYKEAEEILPLIKSTYPNERGLDQILEQMRMQLRMRQTAESLRKEKQ